MNQANRNDKKEHRTRKKRGILGLMFDLKAYRMYSIDSYRVANQSRYTICIGSVESKDEFMKAWSLKVNKSL